jgi:hypothetical protein
MIKGVVIACIIALTSTVAFAAAKNHHSSKKAKSSVTAPSAPKPQGFCFPPGTRCM